MTALAKVFEYDTTPIRTLLIDDEPWFVARDVCSALGYGGGARNAVSKLPARMKGVAPINTPGGQQELSVVNEPGVYRLTMRSTLPSAEAFQDWLAEEVIPAIRKTGRYEMALAVPKSFADALQLAADQARALEQQQAAIAALEPRAQQADFHRAADGLISVADFANKVKAWAAREHGARILHRQVWDFLADVRLLIRGNTLRHNQPTAWAVERDYVRVKETEFETNSHGVQVASSPRLTPAGEGFAWDRAVARIADHGSLDPVKAVEVSR
ncbi:BRO family protein [Micromonospora carbonacea]|uniref:BRO family protein n=1 Tax=Micromonospora carbonacea TaxID=47853 RepID=UPI00371D1A0C